MARTAVWSLIEIYIMPRDAANGSVGNRCSCLYIASRYSKGSFDEKICIVDSNIKEKIMKSVMRLIC